MIVGLQALHFLRHVQLLMCHKCCIRSKAASINQSICRFINPLCHFVYLPIYSPMSHSPILHSPTHPFGYSPAQPTFIHSFIHSFSHSFIHLAMTETGTLSRLLHQRLLLSLPFSVLSTILYYFHCFFQFSYYSSLCTNVATLVYEWLVTVAALTIDMETRTGYLYLPELSS